MTDEGLIKGDTCGNISDAMRQAIIELAIELGVHGGWNPLAYPNAEDISLRWNGSALHAGRTISNHTPEAFIAKMRVSAARPRPIMIYDNRVEFNAGYIQVGCTKIDNETVRAIAAKLIDK